MASRNRRRPGYPKLSPEEKAARLKLVTGWFELLGVRASEARLTGTLNITSWIPLSILARALHELAISKADGYTTAPQPGEIFDRARLIARCDGGDLEYNAETGRFAEPDWARSVRFLISEEGGFRRLRCKQSAPIGLQFAVGEVLRSVPLPVEGGGEKVAPEGSLDVDGATQRELLGDPTVVTHVPFDEEEFSR